MHGKNAAVPFAASRNIRFLYFFSLWLEFIGAFLGKITEYGVFRYSVHRYQKQQNHKHSLDVLAHCTEL